MKYKLLRFSLLGILAMFFGVVHADYEKVTAASDMVDGGEYLIVYEAGNVAFNGALETLDAASNTVAVEIADGKIASSDDADAATFTITNSDAGYTIQSASGNYIGVTSYANGLKQATKATDGYYNAISFDGDGNAVLTVTTSGGDMTLRFNKSSGQERFRYYKSGQQAIQLYKKTGTVADTRTATTVTVGADQTGTVGTFMELPLAVVNDATGAPLEGATVEWSSSNTQVAAIDGTVLKLLSAGEATITATFAGDNNYKGSKGSFKVTVTKAPYTSIAAMLQDITSTKTTVIYKFEDLLVTYVNGSNTYVSDGQDGFLFYGSDLGLNVGEKITGSVTGQLYTYNGLPEMALTANGISAEVTSTGNEVAWTAIAPADLQNNINVPVTIEDAEFVETGSGKNLTFKVGDEQFAVYNQWSIAVSSLEAGATYTLTGVGSVYSKNETTTYQLYLVSFETTGGQPVDTRLDLTLSFPQESYEATMGEDFEEPVLSGVPAEFDGMISYKSSDASVATISYEGDVTLVAPGTVVITAEAMASQTYKYAEASYTLTVNERESPPEPGELANPYTYTFESKVFDAEGTQMLANANWTLTTDAGYFGSDSNKGQQIGSGSKPATTLTLTTADIPGTITKVKVNTSGASGISATFSVSVGETSFEYTDVETSTSASLTNAATDYEFTGSASGAITLSWANNSTKALYVKSIYVEYTNEDTPEPVWAWADIKADFTDQSFFTEADANGATAGLKMNADGTFSRVAADDVTANAVITGKYHSKEHGISNFSATVKVEGPVKISFGTCAWGGNVTVKDETGAEVVPAFTTNTGACYHNNKTDNIVSAYYKGEAATLTIAGGSYVPYFAVEAVDPADIPNDAKVTFDIANVECEGVAPAEITAEIGSKITIPANRTLYKDGWTLTAWTDAQSNQYKAGDEVTVNEDMTLTPVFTENTLTGEITEPTVVIWDFQLKNGAPVLNYQNKTGIYVAQGIINGIAYDNKMSFDTNNGGKIANGSWQDWCQMNGGTKLTIPATKGMTVSLESYSATTTTTIAGSTDYTTEGNVVTYTYEGNDEYIDIVIGDGSYFRYVKAVYPVPAQDEPGSDEQTVIYSWTAGAEVGGTAVASDGQSVGYANAGNTTIRLNGTADFSGNTVTITLDKALKAGDEIAVTGYRNKNAADKVSGVKMKFENGSTTIGSETGLEYVNIDASDDSAADSNRGTEPNTCTFTVPTDADGSKTITMTRSHQGTNLFITKIEITGERSGEEPIVEPTEFVFRDFQMDLRDANGGILTDDEASNSQTVSFAVTVDENNAVTRVEADAENTAAVITGVTGNNHGLQNFSATVPVEGAVQITMSTCSWGGDVTVKNAEGETVATFTTKKGEGGTGCYGGNGMQDENIVSAKYVGDATTLTISGGAYVGFFAVQAIEASSVEVAYSLGNVECQGNIVPTGGTYAKGDEYTIPAQNFTLYKEGYTLTAWTDGENTYATGETITLAGDLNLTPVFTENKVKLADRTEPVTVKFDFQKNNGAPNVQWQNQDNLVWVAQAKVNGTTIDVATRFSTAPGKFNNTNWGDWCQINNGTTFTIPSCKGAVVSVEAYNELSELTIDGQNDYTSAKTISYTIAGSAETVDVVFGSEGSYYRYIQVVLPVVESQGGGESYDNEVATIEWPFNDSGAIATYTAQPDGAFSTVAVNTGDLTVTGVGTRSADDLAAGITFIKLKPAGETTAVQWVAKPAAGLTFTPTKVSMWIQRFGTDAENGVTITAKVGEDEAVTLGNFTAPRANQGVEKDKFAKNDNWTNHVEIELTAEQQAALTSGEELTLSATVGVGSTKEGGFSDVIIEGLVNGTIANVNKYTLATAVAPEEAGSINVYPKANEYEEGSEVTLTATENFGFDFVNWTNAAGEEVSTEAKFKYTVNSNETLTANFVAVETYELALTVDGTNDYMVTVSPAPEVVDGKWMYEAGTAVQLNANQYEGLVTFTNWSDGETASGKLVSMTEDIQITAMYAQADIIAGWDFYKAGSNGRKADFAAQDNDADALTLVNTETGETSGWLDKSTLGGGGYESFTGAAVNWRTGASNGDVGNWHWQTKINAEAFSDINVQFQMLYNYNAYQTYNAEFSLDGESWTKFGSVTMNGNRVVAQFNEQLPAEANNQAELYIRMLADKTSSVDGAASANDGNTLAMFFITGTPKLVDDGVAPVLVSTVPADGATGASASGKIVLTFDERVKVAEGTKGYINNTAVNSSTQNPTTPTVSGKTITFEYKGLEYSTEYQFRMEGNTVADLTDNYLAEPITLTFTTMTRPSVEKKMYDYVVENVDDLMAAIAAAQARTDKNTRYRVFIKDGEYTIPLSSTMKTVNGYDVPECITFINTDNVSFIGESRDGVIITNGIDKNETFAGTYGTTSKYDGIGNSDVFQLRGQGYYWQDLTVETGMDDATGRDLAIHDRGTKNIYKNVGLRGYQDTWTSNNDNGLYYFEGGYVRGRTDYMCGKGDIFWNGVELRQIAGGYAAVPSKPAKYGWIYKDCIIKGEGAYVDAAKSTWRSAESVDGNYTLGRPWGSGTPIALFIDTKMNVVPSAIGWNEMSGGYPARFAEYNSMTSTGSQVDLSGRKKTFGDGHANNPVLTAEEALENSDLHRMYGEWDPTLATEQAPIPTGVTLYTDTKELSWKDSDYALLWAIVKDGKVIDFTTTNSYTVDDVTASYAVRAANEMGGLSEASTTAGITTSITEVANGEQAVPETIYNLNGVRVQKAQKGLYIVNGKKTVVK